MTIHEIEEELRGGGDWLGAARNWLLWEKDLRGQLTWGSDDPVQMTVRDCENLARRVAAAALLKERRARA